MNLNEGTRKPKGVLAAPLKHHVSPGLLLDTNSFYRRRAIERGPPRLLGMHESYHGPVLCFCGGKETLQREFHEPLREGVDDHEPIAWMVGSLADERAGRLGPSGDLEGWFSI